jgi:pyruvate dehydrogenase E2 component (dihydrolipoamide acetyltransferase)
VETAVDVEIRMPKASETMEVGTIVQWLKESGAAVQRGEAIAEIETEKTVVVLEARATGTLRIGAEAGIELPVATTIGTIETA